MWSLLNPYDYRVNSAHVWYLFYLHDPPITYICIKDRVTFRHSHKRVRWQTLCDPDDRWMVLPGKGTALINNTHKNTSETRRKSLWKSGPESFSISQSLFLFSLCQFIFSLVSILPFFFFSFSPSAVIPSKTESHKKHQLPEHRG